MGNVSHLTTRQAAESIGLSKVTLLRAWRAGRIQPAMRTPGGHLRWDPEDLKRFQAELANGSAA